jgi:PAS domain S-box-containing protein
MDEKTKSELSLFFENSIFGAFFMMLDEPVKWIQGGDNREAMQYILHNMRITRVNRTFLEQYDTTEEEMMGKTPYDFFEHDIEQEIELLTNIFNKGKHLDISYEKKADGTDVVFEGDYVVLYDDITGYVSGVFGVQKDITGRVEQERKLKRSLQEKEILLSEIHHRVKNNLAVISALMQLQAYSANDEELAGRLNDSMMRIKTMATIHELLYQQESFSELQFSDILKRLASMLLDNFNMNKNITCKIDCDGVQLNINQAIPCALIVNEVLTNAFKHAFTEKNMGTIWLSVTEDFDLVTLSIRDNGRGFDYADYMVGKIETLGLQIVRILSNQLNGEYSFSSTDEGTGFTLKFRKSDVKGAGGAFII